MKYVYTFDEGNKNMRDILGGKGANLSEMINLNLPVPFGFTISTEVCRLYYDNNKQINKEIENQILTSLKKVEEMENKKLGDICNPLLLSVRSGAKISMPGMMDTILNLGLNDESVIGLSKKFNNERFAYDSYRRFIQMFSDVVMGIDKDDFEKVIDKIKKEKNIKYDYELSLSDLKKIVFEFKKIYKQNTNNDFPQDPYIQLKNAITAVFDSWNTQRAITYRKLNDIPNDIGTAVNVQTMVFGNFGEKSGTGVAFSRNPSTGKNEIFGEYLMNAQGEDIVSGIRTPKPIKELKKDFPKCYEEFLRYAKKLEKHYKDMQDMEFTIENEKLYILQTRNGKRTAEAAVKIACDLVDEGKIKPAEALLMIDPESIDQLLHNVFDEEKIRNAKAIGEGLPASPGASSGKIVFDSESAKKYGKGGKNEKVILVRLETTSDDIEGMIASDGVLTIRGGMTSHAAVVARGMGICCVCGCDNISIDENEKNINFGGILLNEGDYISIDGTTGKIYLGEIETKDMTLSNNFKRIMQWADKYKKLGVKANADNIKDVKKAIELGAEGIGLCRTEHMFFEKERLSKIRKMILSSSEEERQMALNELIVYQKQDFKDMYTQLKKLPMTVRYLDPPLHEFLPKEESEIEELSKQIKISKEKIKNKIQDLKEFNPMMGHRGSRLIVTYPEIARMQTRAILEAAIEVTNEYNYKISPEIMIPLIGDLKELKFIKNIVEEEAEKVKKEYNSNINYHIGTMIEVPRAAILANDIAKEAEFFSFGTNDLTQMTFGFSRDDSSKFLNYYYNSKIYDKDPFEKIDTNGVGELIKIAIEKGRESRKNIELGICGEHGGDPYSIDFFNKIGLDYISCSSFRIPVAKLSAAQAAIKFGTQK